MNELKLINIIGKDSKGLTAKMTGILAKYHIHILDIGQGVIHDHISLGILVEIPDNQNFADTFKDLLFEGHKLEVMVTCRDTSHDDYENWVKSGGKERRIITILGEKPSADQISKVAEVITAHDMNIDTVTRLSGRLSISNPELRPRFGLQMSVSGTPVNVMDMRAKLLSISTKTGVDISFQVDDIYRKNRKLVVFDMDSTLIQTEVIDELAKLSGKGDIVTAITESAMRGDIDFKESFKRRVAELKGLDIEKLQFILDNLPITEGARRVTKVLKGLGYKLGILSGGFTFVGHYLKEILDLDYVFANELEVENGVVTGRVTGDIIDGERKAELLREIAASENLKLEQTIAVGDGANDLPMLSISGLGVAFHAKPVVREKAKSTITSMGLDGLLYLIGIHDREVQNT